jgi:predicted DsbA family dithiol-disulfide isomerase
VSAHLPAVLQIDVVSDVVCPWCYIGKRQLDAAVLRWRQGSPDSAAPEIRWRPFQLNPGMPAQGISRSDYLVQKFGSPDGGGRFDAVRAAARAAGLDLKLEAIKVQPNTLKAHGLLELADEGASQMALAEGLFSAYFIDGRDLSDDQTLREVALAAGVNEDLVEAGLTLESVTQLVAAADAELREFGVSGVPLFIIGTEAGQRVPVHGAQGTEALLRAMRQAQLKA